MVTISIVYSRYDLKSGSGSAIKLEGAVSTAPTAPPLPTSPPRILIAATTEAACSYDRIQTFCALASANCLSSWSSGAFNLAKSDKGLSYWLD